MGEKIISGRHSSLLFIRFALHWFHIAVQFIQKNECDEKHCCVFYHVYSPQLLIVTDYNNQIIYIAHTLPLKTLPFEDDQNFYIKDINFL